MAALTALKLQVGPVNLQDAVHPEGLQASDAGMKEFVPALGTAKHILHAAL